MHIEKTEISALNYFLSTWNFLFKNGTLFLLMGQCMQIHTMSYSSNGTSTSSWKQRNGKVTIARPTMHCFNLEIKKKSIRIHIKTMSYSQHSKGTHYYFLISKKIWLQKFYFFINDQKETHLKFWAHIRVRVHIYETWYKTLNYIPCKTSWILKEYPHHLQWLLHGFELKWSTAIAKSKSS